MGTALKYTHFLYSSSHKHFLLFLLIYTDVTMYEPRSPPPPLLPPPSPPFGSRFFVIGVGIREGRVGVVEDDVVVVVVVVVVAAVPSALLFLGLGV